MSYVSLAIFSPLRQTFDYILPAHLPATLGMRVLAPFGRKEVVGIIVALKDHVDYPADKLRPINALLEEQAILSPELLELINWASTYYFIPLGMLYKLALPKKIRDGEPLNLNLVAKKHALTQAPDYALNSEQILAFNGIKKSLGHFQVSVLDGVTGSGKTEVYFKLIEECLNQGQQALMLIPEINLGPQTTERLIGRFPEHNIGLLHSKITEKKRYEIWQAARIGNLDIIIGTRLAAFSPFKNLGLIIIDEEHDLSFKQQDACRYSAKDLLIKRAHLLNCPIVLGSATLSLETWHNVKTKKYAYYALPRRAGNAKIPQIEIVDTSHKKLFAGMSEYLLHEIKHTLAQNQQVFIFLNRRGFAPVLFCTSCNWHLQCTKCSSKMIMHYKTQYMICHHCESKKTIPTSCPECHNNDLNPTGTGTQRLELALQEKFYDQQILRVDRDTIKTPKQLELALAQIIHNKVKIIVGTQMLAKGHHFPHLSLVAILDVDGALYSADFRAIERVGQLIIQVAGRAGRGDYPGRVLIQTSNPQHPLFPTLITQTYQQFLELCLDSRAEFMLPPLSYQILIISHSKRLSLNEEFLLNIQDYIRNSAYREQVLCLGPMPGILEKKNNIYSLHLTLQSNSRKVLHILLNELLNQPDLFLAVKNVKWIIDVDPLQLA